MLRQPAHFSKLKFGVVFLVLLFAAALLSAKPGQAAMQELADAEMAGVYATGFASFTWETVGTQDIARANFNIETKMYADIASAKMGYYDNGISTPPLGWDQAWTGVTLGTPTEDLVAKDFYIEAGFDTATINGETTRTLNYIKIGTTDLKGKISANFESISGDIAGPAVYSFARTNLGAATIEAITPASGPQGFCLSLDRTNGYLVRWDSATVTTP